MDHRYYYDSLEYTGVERRDRARRRTREIAAVGVAGATLAAAGQVLGHVFGMVDGQALVLSCTVAALSALALHRPLVRLLRSDSVLLRAVNRS